MLTYLLIIITLYLAGNAYIFIRAKQALKVKSLGVKIFLTVLFWICALSFFGTMLTRNLEMPVFISHSMYTIGTSWLIFTLYVALFLLLFDILKLFKVVYKYRFYLSLVFTLGLLGCGVYNYHHPETNVVSILTNKRYEDTPQAIKIVAINDVHLGNGTGKAALKKYVEMINETASNIEEIKARGGKVITVIAKGDEQVRKSSDYFIEVPVVAECLMPIVVSVPLQLLAYHIAVNKGRDVDQPRNLAKSVTVE